MTSQKKISVSKLIGGGYNQFWHSKNFYRVVKGSRGSKKSKTIALNIIYRMMKYPWANTLVMRRFSNTLKQSCYTDLKWAIYQQNVSHLWKTNESLPELTYLPTGQKILLRGIDDPLKITSITVENGLLTWMWLEEAYELESEENFRTVVESLRGAHPDPSFFKQVTISFNPWHDGHFLKKIFFDEDTREDDTFAITTTFRVNEWLDEQDKKRYLSLYRTNPSRARIVCDGEWGVSEGLVFDNFQVVDFDTLQKIKAIQEVTHGMDYGFSQDPTTLVSSVVDLSNKEIWIYDEHYEAGMVTEDLYHMLADKHLLKAHITGDSAEPRLIKELVTKGVRRLHKSIKGAGSIRQGISFLQGFRIYIHPSCTRTIEEFNTYTFKKDKTGKWLNEPVDANNHILDALRYSMERYHLGKKADQQDQYKALQSLGL
ncbi:PBSX family phage terminase large subunit [Shouchella lonarensis]|uniref:Phage terminase large subunit n=1 Tax=Shouchella lonarensis TaxID=1464122 RepID=A0A1G6HR18_9BACI|nr:PBSX family phage terminase large subunit [Shouchella lonarensis]SDB96593.1 phage terminase large subunit [Shouchella lonarensis]